MSDITKDINLELVKEICIGCLQKCLVINGRARRREFWIFFLASLVAGLLVGWIPVIGFLFSLAICVPSFTVGVRRLHDTDRSGWMALLAFIPIAGLIILIYFWVQEGTAGENKYGPNPK
ncbi:MAG: DUF805 domain-containing protein [Treponema sp.]|jgi:uncharacterized membrane protein YhaH (DUF805 family)|nr:DUF805 domain-containing protein [Treponema sp.]